MLRLGLLGDHTALEYIAVHSIVLQCTVYSIAEGEKKEEVWCSPKKRGEEAACEQDTIMEALSTNRPGIIAARASILHARTALLACSTTAIDGKRPRKVVTRTWRRETVTCV